jgi:splicing factor 3A subunit 3
VIFFLFLDLVEFTDEEGYGKFLDLHECYEKYINLKGIEKVDYITYLATFDQLFDIPKERKTGEYRKYLLCLIEYLTWFVQRVKPLMDLDSDLQAESDAIMVQWDSGTVQGWPVI